MTPPEPGQAKAGLVSSGERGEGRAVRGSGLEWLPAWEGLVTAGEISRPNQAVTTNYRDTYWPHSHQPTTNNVQCRHHQNFPTNSSPLIIAFSSARFETEEPTSCSRQD